MTALTIFLLLALPIALAGLARLRQICRMRRAARELAHARICDEARAEALALREHFAAKKAALIEEQRRARSRENQVYCTPNRRYALGRRRRLAV